MQKTDRLHLGVGAIAIPCVIGGFAMMDNHPLIAWILYIVAGGAFFWGVYPFVFRKHRKKAQVRTAPSGMQLPKTDYTKLDTVSQKDKDLIGHMGLPMLSTHGHSDLTGMVSDYANGVDINELMFKPCHVCGIIRNQRGKKR